MGFYNSGFKRVLGGIATSRAKTEQNTKVDDTRNTAVALNTAKTGVTASQATDIIANTAKKSMVLGTTEDTALAGDTPVLSFTIDGTDLVITVGANVYTIRAN